MTNDNLFDGSDVRLLGKCAICGEYIEQYGYCEDCRDGGDLEDILESVLDA